MAARGARAALPFLVDVEPSRVPPTFFEVAVHSDQDPVDSLVHFRSPRCRIRRKHEDETRRSCGVSGTEGAQEHNLVTANKNQKQVSGQFTGMVITCSMSSCGYMVYRLVMNDCH